MFPLINNKPHFIPFDVVKVLETGNIAFISEINCNLGQNTDRHQWSYSITYFSEVDGGKCAWFYPEELELIGNIFQSMAKQITHPFGNKTYNFSIDNKRRTED